MFGQLTGTPEIFDQVVEIDIGEAMIENGREELRLLTATLWGHEGGRFGEQVGVSCLKSSRNALTALFVRRD